MTTELNCSPFFPTTDSGDVSSIKDVDMLVLLRVPSSCRPEHTDYYGMSLFTRLFVFAKGSVMLLHTKTLIVYNKIRNVSTINLIGCG